MPMVFKKCPDCESGLPVACKTCHCGHVFLAKRTPGKPADRKVDVLPGRLRPERSRREIRHHEYVFNNPTAIPQKQSIYSTPQLPRLLPKPPINETPTSRPPMIKNTNPHLSTKTQQIPINTPVLFTSKPLQATISLSGMASIPQETHTPGTNHDNKQKESSDGKPINCRRRGRPKGSKDKIPRGSKIPLDSLIFRPKRKKDLPNGMALRADKKGYNLASDDSHYSNDSDFDIQKYEFEKRFCFSEKQEIFALILKDINAKIARQTFII